MARPCKLTKGVQDRICKAISLGATYELAAAYGGVCYETFNRWMKGKSKRFRQFFNAVKAAEARAAVDWLAQIEHAALSGNWTAAAWKLERRYPKSFGLNQRLELGGENGEPIKLEVKLPHDWGQGGDRPEES
ncbi:MAG: hypothetical protein GHCLOJNM_03081 [bacterium]|nr:hypothetical protein [bacterium]